MTKATKTPRASKKNAEPKTKAKKAVTARAKHEPEVVPPTITMLPLSSIYANDEQARKHFDEGKLHELAASIRSEGQISPIIVRPDGTGKFMIVAGERRYRAFQLLELNEVQVIIRELSDASLTYQMIIENLQRADITALEEARAFQKAMDDLNLTAEEFAQKVGILQVFRVTDRLTLLNLKPELQQHLEQGYMTPTQAFYIGKVAKKYQDAFWRMVRTGKVNSEELAAVAQSFVDTESQPEMFPEAKLSPDEVKAIHGLEQSIDAMATILNRFFSKDGEMDIVKKIDRNRASTIAGKLEVMSKTLIMAQKKLLEPVAQQKVIDKLATSEEEVEEAAAA